VDGKHGVKDLDVWTFFRQLPDGERFPADRRNRHMDFGPSGLGRQAYDLGRAHDERQRRQWMRWSAFEGRRVDLFMRALPVQDREDGLEALRRWLSRGQQSGKGSASWLAIRAIVVVAPTVHRGRIVWDPFGGDRPE
jgi:hypothetical protein